MGSHYLTASVEKTEGLKHVGMHDKRVLVFVLPKQLFTSKGLTPYSERGFLQRGAADMRSKMSKNMMIVEMTMTEQQQYLRDDDHSESRLTALTPVMPNEDPRSIMIV